MRSTKTKLLLAVAALALFALPATASANWTKNGSEFTGGMQWSQEGAPLESGEPSFTVEGTLYWAGVAGSISCPVSATVFLAPGSNEGSYGGFSGNAAACKVGGSLGVSCSKVTSVSAPAFTAVYASEVSGKRVISIPSFEVSYGLSGQKVCEELGAFKVAGAVTATPDNSDQISSLALSGQLSASSKLGSHGKVNLYESSLGVAPAKKYGVIKQGTIPVTGGLGFSTAFGAVSCVVNGVIALQPGSTGKFTSLTMNNCSSGGPGVGKCNSFTTNLPTVVDEGTYITIKGLELDGDGEGCFIGGTGDLKALPDKAGGISSTYLSGKLGSIEWTGSLKWTPAGVYGL